jgi:hypothetical protein
MKWTSSVAQKDRQIVYLWCKTPEIFRYGKRLRRNRGADIRMDRMEVVVAGEGSCALSVVDIGSVELSGYTARGLEFLNGDFYLHVLCTDELCYDFK